MKYDKEKFDKREKNLEELIQKGKKKLEIIDCIITIIVVIILEIVTSSFTVPENYGTVKFYNENKGFGYIVDNNSSDELFVYENGLIDEIEKGEIVIYKIINTRKGLEAYDVRLK